MRIMACFAASLDGKITLPGTSGYTRISSDEDIRRLKALRDEADALLMGGSTFRAYPKVHPGLNPAKIPLHCILTRQIQNLPPDAPIFQQDTPRADLLIISPEPPTDTEKAQYPAMVEWLSIPELKTAPIQAAPPIIQHLSERGVQALLVEGGGEVMSLLLEAQVLQELYLTLCPLLIGGHQTPGLVGGKGFASPPQTEILSLEPVGQELFLHLKLHYPD